MLVDVTLLFLFVTMCLAAGVGGAVGSMLGHAAGRGWLIVGGMLGGLAFVIAAGLLAGRLRWVERHRVIWTVLGAVLGFLSAVLVALSTIATPIGPALSTLLVGIGAVLGATLGQSAHDEGLTPDRRAR